jgi:hypothetical protein
VGQTNSRTFNQRVLVRDIFEHWIGTVSEGRSSRVHGETSDPARTMDVNQTITTIHCYYFSVDDGNGTLKAS